jgi:acylphosphatase
MPKRLLIRGRVQGVGYRQWMVAEAERLGITGWVRNRRDGSVEALVDGPPEAIARMIERAHAGPRAAQVESVESEEAQGRFEEFGWLPTE